MGLINSHIQEYGEVGLRTLLLAKKVISPGKFQDGLIKKLENQETPLDELSELFETEMTLVGATAIEDKL
jgi:magnesium-transporting ATPase (P-type)